MDSRYVRSNGGIVIPVGPVSVDLHNDGDRICGHLERGVVFEPDSLAAWAAIVKPGTTVLDIGAYSGLFAIAAAKLGASVIAFEPMIEMQACARINFARNDVTVDLREAAVTDRDGQGVIGFSPNVKCTSGASLVEMGGGQRTVELVRLDTIMDILPTVSAIKIDVERNEPAVIRGAAGLINRDSPALLVECLEPAMRKTIEALLPAYQITAVLDVRNLLLLPR